MAQGGRVRRAQRQEKMWAKESISDPIFIQIREARWGWVFTNKYSGFKGQSLINITSMKLIHKRCLQHLESPSNPVIVGLVIKKHYHSENEVLNGELQSNRLHSQNAWTELSESCWCEENSSHCGQHEITLQQNLYWLVSLLKKNCESVWLHCKLLVRQLLSSESRLLLEWFGQNYSNRTQKI